MLESSFRLGSVAGIRIGVHYTWFIIFFLLSSSLFALFSHEQPDWSGATRLTTAMVTTLLFFVSIILHELGHSFMAMRRGIRVRSITLFIFGGLAQTEKEADSAITEFLIAVAGPAVSFILAAMFYLLSAALESVNSPLAEAMDWLSTINMMVASFNLIPGFPLDGGRVLRAIIWRITGDAQRGMQWAVMGGKLVAYGLMFYGMLSVLLTGLLINGLWLIGIGWFLFNAAEASGRSFITEHLLGDVRIADIMQTDPPMVGAEVTVLDWLDQYVLYTGLRAYLVTRDSRVIGLVTMTDVGKLPRPLWPERSVQDIMTPLEQLHSVRPDSAVHEVLHYMNLHGVNQVPVIEADQVLGWVDREKLLTIIQLHNQTGR